MRYQQKSMNQKSILHLPNYIMKKIFNILPIILLAAIVYACGGTEAANDKLAQLETLKQQKAELDNQISELEKDLIASGELKKKEGNTVLVTSIAVKPISFKHEVEVRGEVSSKKNVMVAAETMGKISMIKVNEGQNVKKGQLLIQLDADILRNNISEVKTQLELATTIFERQSNLWKQNIGTEVQFLQAKNNKESLEARLETLDSQLQQSNVYAPFDGIIDNIPVRIGEMAQPGQPLLRIVNQKEMYISADVSESFLGKFSEGQTVSVFFPNINKRLTSKISSLGQVIKSENRTFEIEVELPTVDFIIKPNQIVVLNLVDYQNDNALIVPTKIVQKDSKGNYLYELVKKGQSTVSRKIYVDPGVSFDQQIEILSGLKEGQVIANEGHRELANDVAVTIK